MNKRILIVDDQVDFRFLKWALPGHELLIVSDPLTAVAIAKEFRPDLFLLDLVMPNMNGSTLAEQIKKEASLKSVPIVFISAMVRSKGDDGCAIQIGGHSAIGKPFRIAALRRCVEQHLGLLDSSVSGVERLKSGFIVGDIRLPATGDTH